MSAREVLIPTCMVTKETQQLIQRLTRGYSASSGLPQPGRTPSPGTSQSDTVRACGRGRRARRRRGGVRSPRLAVCEPKLDLWGLISQSTEIRSGSTRSRPGSGSRRVTSSAAGWGITREVTHRAGGLNQRVHAGGRWFALPDRAQVAGHDFTDVAADQLLGTAPASPASPALLVELILVAAVRGTALRETHHEHEPTADVHPLGCGIS